MIGCTDYVRCDCCYAPMHGILSGDARKTCHECGGRPLIADLPTHRELVRMARERVRQMYQPRPTTRRPFPRNPNLPGAA